MTTTIMTEENYLHSPTARERKLRRQEVANGAAEASGPRQFWDEVNLEWVKEDR